MDTLAPYREKWREVPGGDDNSGRALSTDLLAMPDAELLAFSEVNAAKRAAGSLSWLGPLYRDFCTGRRVLELGGGLGYDGFRFAAQGAKWTFADIASDNLKVIERVASLKGISIKTFLIRENLSFDTLGGRYDAVFASGSLHHVPFEIAQEECLSVLRRLRPDGRWIELAYPKERWLNAGSPPFDQWGKATDGERTPWAEWYDADKLRARLGPLPRSPPSSTSTSTMTISIGSTSSSIPNLLSSRCGCLNRHWGSACVLLERQCRIGHMSIASVLAGR